MDRPLNIGIAATWADVSASIPMLGCDAIICIEPTDRLTYGPLSSAVHSGPSGSFRLPGARVAWGPKAEASAALRAMPDPRGLLLTTTGRVNAKERTKHLDAGVTVEALGKNPSTRVYTIPVEGVGYVQEERDDAEPEGDASEE